MKLKLEIDGGRIAYAGFDEALLASVTEGEPADQVGALRAEFVAKNLTSYIEALEALPKNPDAAPFYFPKEPEGMEGRFEVTDAALFDFPAKPERLFVTKKNAWDF